MSKTVEDIGTLKINLLSQADYEAEVIAGTVEDDELYLTPASNSGVSDVEVDGTSVVTGGVAEVDLTGKSDVGHTHTKTDITDFPTITDENVKQTVGTPSSYSYWRPLVVGSSSGSSETFSPSTTTGGTYTFSTVKVQPSTGTIRAGALSLTNGSYTSVLSDTTLTANRTVTVPDKSGTMAMTSDIPTVNNATLTIQKNGTTVDTFTANASTNVTANITTHDVPSGGTIGQVLMKNSSTDYDCSWTNLPIYNGGVS